MKKTLKIINTSPFNKKGIKVLSVAKILSIVKETQKINCCIIVV